MLHSHLLGTGAYAPKRILTNQDLEKLVETTDAWIIERTGIKERRIAAEGEVTSDMAVIAARHALAMAGTRAEDLDMIIVATVSADMPLPSCAVIVQAKLGATRAFAFDIGAACAGSLYGLSIADQFIKTGRAERVLVIGAELLTRLVNWSDRNTCVLFGDAAGAMVVGPARDPGRGLLSTHLHSDGTAAGILSIPGGGSKHPQSAEVLAKNMHKIAMNGREIYKFAVRVLPQAILEALAANGLTVGDIDHIVSHQANARIVESVLEEARHSPRKMLAEPRALRQYVECLAADFARRGQPGGTAKARRSYRDDGNWRRDDMGQCPDAVVAGDKKARR